MNQEKIGKFIALMRKGKNLTQKDLAIKLGVSINAVSKWERGICLMDMSLLKPLSEVLDVSIIEIINGEKVAEENIKAKTNEAIESTLNYSKTKISKSKKLVIVSIIAFIFIAFICYKGILYKIYEPGANNIESLEPFLDCLKEPKNITLYKRTIEPDKYLIVNDIKIRNDFTNFERIDSTDEMDSTKFLLIKDGKTTATFMVGKTHTFTDLFSYEATIYNGENESNYNKLNKIEFFKKYDINNDLDFFNYLKNYDPNINILMSTNKIKEKSALNLYLSIINKSISDYTIINGDYSGYIFSMKNGVKEINILRNDKRYVFTFWGDSINDIEYIKDLMSTLEIK